MDNKTKLIFAIFIVITLLAIAYLTYFSAAPELANDLNLPTHQPTTVQNYPRHDVPATGPTYAPTDTSSAASSTAPTVPTYMPTYMSPTVSSAAPTDATPTAPTVPTYTPTYTPPAASTTTDTSEQPVTQNNQPTDNTSTHTTTAATQSTTQPAIIGDSGLNSAGTPVVQPPPQPTITYGRRVRLRNLHPVYGGYASACGLAGICGDNVTLKPLEAFRQAWIIEGKPAGSALMYGDIIKLYNSSTRLYLSPCNIPVETGCGVNVTMRPNAEFTKWEPNSNLRSWQVAGPVGETVRAGDTINLKALATRWPGHSGWLSVCGKTPTCGYNLSLRPDHAGYDAFAFELA